MHAYKIDYIHTIRRIIYHYTYLYNEMLTYIYEYTLSNKLSKPFFCLRIMFSVVLFNSFI